MTKIYCSNCGNLLPSLANFCFKCGAAQHGTDSAVYRADAPEVATAVKPTQSPKGSHKTSLRLINKQHLCPRTRVAFAFSYVAKTAILIPLFAIGFFLEPLVSVVAFVAYIAMILIVTQMVYQNYFFSIDKTGFQKWYGIIHKHQVSIPYEQIQNVNITRSLLDQLLGLSRIHIETAGGANNDTRQIVGGNTTDAEALLPGVTLKQAKKIHDLLLQKASENQ